MLAGLCLKLSQVELPPLGLNFLTLVGNPTTPLE
jgi:hypothetical protein